MGRIQRQTKADHLYRRWTCMLNRLAAAMRTFAAAPADSNNRQQFLIEIWCDLPPYLQRKAPRLPDQSAISDRTHQCGLTFSEMDVNFLELNSYRHALSFRAPCLG